MFNDYDLTISATVSWSPRIMMGTTTLDHDREIQIHKLNIFCYYFKIKSNIYINNNKFYLILSI